MTLANYSRKIVLQRSPEQIPGLRITEQHDRKVIDIAPEVTGNVVSVLQTQPDIFTYSPAPGQPRQITLQGGRARHVQVMLDGVTLNRAGEPYDLSTIPAASIERIEVVTGPVPGSAGMDGVVKLWSRRHEQSSLEAAYDTGAYGLKRWRGDFRLADRRISAHLGMQREESKGDYEYKHPFTDEDMTRKNNDSVTESFEAALDWRNAIPLRVALSTSRFERGLPGPMNEQTSFDAARLRGSTTRWLATLGEERLQAHFLTENERTHYRNTESTNFQKRGAGDTTSGLRKVVVSGRHAVEAFGVTAQCEAQREIFEYDDLLRDQSDIEEVSRDNIGFEGSVDWERAQAEWTYSSKATVRGDWGHARLDRAEASGRLELAIENKRLIPLRLELSGGRSFTQPSFYDLYWHGDSQAMGNPDLKPESNVGVSSKLQATGESWRCAFAVNQSWYDDLVYWAKSISSWKPYNLDRAEKRVYTLDGEWRLLGFIELGGSWSRILAWDRSLDDDGEHGDHWGKVLTYTPSSLTKVWLAVSPGEWECRVDWSRTGRRYTTRDNLKDPMPDYKLMNVELAWSPVWRNIDCRVYAGCDNILDERYEIYSSDPEAGRGWSAGASVSVKL